MDWFIQLHNMDFNDLPMGKPPFSDDGTFLITTRRSEVQKAAGKVFLILAIGKPRRYFLWRVSDISEVMPNEDGSFLVSGAGWELALPAELKGPAFEEFKQACASFVCIRRMTKLPYVKTLIRLAEKRQPLGKGDENISFLRELYRQASHDSKNRGIFRAYLEHFGEPVRALSVQQPHAEAIQRGVKKLNTDQLPRMFAAGFIFMPARRVSGLKMSKDAWTITVYMISVPTACPVGLWWAAWRFTAVGKIFGWLSIAASEAKTGHQAKAACQSTATCLVQSMVIYVLMNFQIIK